jgi:hypothetical protein
LNLGLETLFSIKLHVTFFIIMDINSGGSFELIGLGIIDPISKPSSIPEIVGVILVINNKNNDVGIVAVNGAHTIRIMVVHVG